MRLPAASLLLLAGCIAPGAYGSARLLDPGDQQWVLTMEAIDVVDDVYDDGNLYPRVAYRRGLTRAIELGLQTAAYPTLGADIKIGIVRAPTVALALAPTVAYSYAPEGISETAGWAELRLPLLLELVIAESWSLSATAGLGAGIDLDRKGPDLIVQGAALGVRHEGDGFALQPTLGYFEAYAGGESSGLLSAGLSLTLGDLAGPR